MRSTTSMMEGSLFPQYKKYQSSFK
ncbi:BgTH12-02547 [Blumeria graminis f. sp. triticale]|uniref:BgTH12-02547 n=1 Tax=Blumeria graminis f. sp. triticale TaxID=1689686 RepID=A0A9W4GE90_BLUGR|nr:BgTH12-02547 [Blumeria graminis f. sp. triticale]